MSRELKRRRRRKKTNYIQYKTYQVGVKLECNNINSRNGEISIKTTIMRYSKQEMKKKNIISNTKKKLKRL